MPTANMLPQKASPGARSVNISISDAKLFDINKFNFVCFDDLLKQTGDKTGLEFELFISNSLETQWGYLRIVDGKPQKLVPLLEINMVSVTPVNPNGLNADGYIVNYCLSIIKEVTEIYIPSKAVSRTVLLEFFSLPPQGSKKKDDLCNRLLKHLILKKALDSDPSNYIETGTIQGWRIKSPNTAIFEAKNNYPEVLYPILPKSILHCEKARIRADNTKYRAYVQEQSDQFFEANIEMKALYLYRITSYNSSFAHQCGSDFDLLPNVIPSETIPTAMIAAVVQNNCIRSGDLLTLGGNIRTLRERIAEVNDTVLTVIDDTLLDEAKRRRSAISAIESAVLFHAKGNRFVPVIISSYADQQILPDLRCPLALGDLNSTNFEPSHISRLLEMKDAYFIAEVERHFQEYFDLYRRNHVIVSSSVPLGIPPCRHPAFICLIAASRTYDQFMEPLFGEETERLVTDWLSNAADQSTPVNEELVRRFARYLNQEIQSGRFRFITRTKYIILDRHTNSVIIDDDHIYIETDVIEELAVNKLGLRNVNALTDALNVDESLTINDHHSKCYRLKVQNSAGEPDWLYTYGISKQLISKESRRRLDCADQYHFFLTYDELATSGILPLGRVFDGLYVGRDVSYLKKGNDSIFITGQSGKGKTFCAINLLPSFAMLGFRMLVFDVSGSFTREEVLGLNADADHRPLTENIVNTLFEFIEVDEGKSRLPVDPLYIGDCTGLSDKKRRVSSFIRAAAGQLDKDDDRIVTGLISTMLQKHRTLTSVPVQLLRDTLENGGKESCKVLNLIRAVLDDLEIIGCQDQSWGEFFNRAKKIPVISLGHEESDSVHPLLDVLLASAFEWQRDHKSVPMLITIDEIKRQSFADGCPLHTIITQGRKYGCRLLGITQEYVSRDSHAIDIMREAGIKLFFEPANGRDKIAADLGYKSVAHAGFGSMRIGEFILHCELFNKDDGGNEKTVIPCETLKFEDTPLYERFKREYGIVDPQVNLGESSDLSEAPQSEGAEAQAAETLPEMQGVFYMPLTSPAPELMESEHSTVEAQLPQLPDTVNEVLEVFNEVPEAIDNASEVVDDITDTFDDVSEAESLVTMESSAQESIVIEPEEGIQENVEQLAQPQSEPDEPKEDPQILIEQELQQQFRDIQRELNPDDPYLESTLRELLAQIMEKYQFDSQNECSTLYSRFCSLIESGTSDCQPFYDELQKIYDELWPSTQVKG